MVAYKNHCILEHRMCFYTDDRSKLRAKLFWEGKPDLPGKTYDAKLIRKKTTSKEVRAFERTGRSEGGAVASSSKIQVSLFSTRLLPPLPLRRPPSRPQAPEPCAPITLAPFVWARSSGEDMYDEELRHKAPGSGTASHQERLPHIRDLFPQCFPRKRSRQ